MRVPLPDPASWAVGLSSDVLEDLGFSALTSLATRVLGGGSILVKYGHPAVRMTLCLWTW